MKNMEIRIEDLEKALKLTSDQLSGAIDTINNNLKFNICLSDLNDPEYLDKQTCYENQMLLRIMPEEDNDK